MENKDKNNYFYEMYTYIAARAQYTVPNLWLSRLRVVMNSLPESPGGIIAHPQNIGM